MAATHTPASLVDALTRTLAGIGATHLLCLLHVLDACMKHSPRLVGAIGSTLDRLLVPPLPLSKLQSAEERVRAEEAVTAVLRHWSKYNLIPHALAERAFKPSAMTERQGYFWNAAQRVRSRAELVAAARACDNPAPLRTPAHSQDPRVCDVCGDVLDMYFCDDMNGWAYGDAVRRQEDDLPVHGLCA